MDDYHRYPKLPGWKYECYDGAIHASPAMHSIATALAVTPRIMTSPCDLVSPNDIPREQLVRVFIDTFKDSVEFFNWPLAQIEEHANKWTNALLDGKRGRPLAISRVMNNSNYTPFSNRCPTISRTSSTGSFTSFATAANGARSAAR